MALFIWEPRVALGFTGGVITGAGTLSALVLVLNRVVVPPRERTGHPAPWVVLHVVKFLIAAAFAYLLIVRWSGDVMAFAGGYSIALLVLVGIMAGEPTVANGLSARTDEKAQKVDPDASED
ncbi:MAG: hypothetical protein GF393_06515 [Armatimonadia bacterium]|nr:hypothetical protein [Armatimonadia bacterium]